MAQDVIYPGEGSVCTWEKGEIHCFGVKCVSVGMQTSTATMENSVEIP